MLEKRAPGDQGWAYNISFINYTVVFHEILI